MWILDLARLAVGVEFFGHGTDFIRESVRAIGEWERVKAARFHIDAVISNTEPAACAL